MVSSGSEGGGGVPVPPPEPEVRRSASRSERKERKARRESKSESPRPIISLPAMSSPIIMTTPATPDGDPHYSKSVRKHRSTTMPVPSARVASFLPPAGGAAEGHSRPSSMVLTTPMPGDAFEPAQVLYTSAILPMARAPPISMPPYPATPPPMLTGQDYISSLPSTSAPINRIPAVLRAGAEQEHEHHRHRRHGSAEPSPRDSAVEIGEGRELRRADNSRAIQSRSRSSTLPAKSSLVHSTNVNEEISPTARHHSSYRDSILSTFSHRSDTHGITRSLSTKSTASTATPLSPAARRPDRTSSHRTEDYLSILKNFDTIFLIDDSPSMLYENRWEDTAAALASISEIATKYDSDGIDIHFLNSAEKDVTGVQSPDQVLDIFHSVRPAEGGSTPLGSRLDGLLRGYLDRYAHAREEAAASTSTSAAFSQKLSELIKPLNVVVLTDGDATDDPESVIVSVARSLDRLNAPLAQVGIQMFQVGGDPEAEEFLRGLDDDLVEVYGVRDMVDTTPYRGAGEGNFTGEEMLKVLVGAVNRRVDRRGNYRMR
ncbi:hypothetical protein EV426DRAFT_707012 [Tirmania nivea]|nr:hypothetical protein EV426DRAFT_707012 [Tirmania nivea]